MHLLQEPLARVDLGAIIRQTSLRTVDETGLTLPIVKHNLPDRTPFLSIVVRPDTAMDQRTDGGRRNSMGSLGTESPHWCFTVFNQELAAGGAILIEIDGRVTALDAS